jgi:hypothetical protein
VDKKLAAEKTRALLRGRIARLLGCTTQELPHMKISTMAHFLFAVIGDSETMGGFNTTLNALVDLLGFELLWDIEPEEKETPNAVIN